MAQLTLRSLYLDLTRTAEISDNFLTVDPIPPITSAMIANGTIVNADISESADISGSKIAASSISLDKIVNVDGQTFQQYLSNLGGLPGSSTITSDMIVNDTIVNADISPNADISGSKIADGSITSAKIVNGTIVNANISDSADISGSKIADGSITSVKIANGTIVNADISPTADISGSKIEPATETAAGVVTTGTQSFSGLKTFADSLAIQGDFSSTGSTMLDNPRPVLCSVYNTDGTHPYGHIDVLVRNTNSTNPTNFIVIQIPINTSTSSEVSSYYEITLIGRQPITTIDTSGSTVSADSAVTSTTRCLLTVTGIEVTTTILGKSNTTEPFVATRLLQSSGGPNNTTNLLIGIGFRKFSAYHVKGVRAGAEPIIHFITHTDPIITQPAADNLLTDLGFV